jgi:predicted Fe-S protein YdhL (DUF1289 family)
VQEETMQSNGVGACRVVAKRCNGCLGSHSKVSGWKGMGKELWG